MKELLGLVGLFVLVMVLFGSVPESLQQDQTDSGIVYNENSVKSNDLFFGIHIRADEDDGRVSGVSNLGFASKRSFWDTLFGRISTTVDSTVNPLVASVQVNNLFDDTDSTISTTFVSPCQVGLEDIGSHPYEDAVRTAAEYCLVDGYTSSRFYPDNFLRREELAKITVNMMLLKLEGFVRDFESIDYDPFVDVPSTNPLAPSISYVARLGVWENLFSDANRRQFDPQGFVSPQDMIELLSMVARLYPNYMGSTQISVDLGQDRLTRGEAVAIMMDFFWGNSQPVFQSEAA